MSHIIRGCFRDFATEGLMGFLTGLGRDVKIVLKRAPKPRKQGRLRVRASWASRAIVLASRSKTRITVRIRSYDQSSRRAQYADDVAELIRNGVGRWAEYAGYTIRTEVRTY